MKKLLFILVFIFTAQNINAQKLDYGNDLSAIKICNAIQGNNFLSESEADSALDKILNVIGASKRFVLQSCNNINNAVALTFNGVRYIMYDPEFMSGLRYSNDWYNMFVLAHEVGHHINGHTVDALVVSGKSPLPLHTSRQQELEADEFAGFVLGRLGANLDQALSAVNNFSDGDDSYSTHPRRSKRITAVKKGFNESGGKVNSSNSGKPDKIYNSPYSNFRFTGVDYVTKNWAKGVYTGTVAKGSGIPFGYGVWKNSRGMKYEGEFSDGEFNGYGKVKYSTGNSYEGEWVDGKRSGKGVFTYSDGAKRIGNFSGGSLSGPDCKIITKTHILEGRFSYGAIIKATYTKKDDGSSFEIGFSDNFGNGVTTYSIENTTYTGNFKYGRTANGKKLKKHKGKDYKKKERQIGIDFFIPGLILNDLDIKLEQPTGQTSSMGYPVLESTYVYYLERNHNDGEVISKGYFTYSFWNPKRSGFIEEIITNKEANYDKFQGIYWDDKKNGYGVKFYEGKVVEKGIYKNGKFVKKEDFDLELMLETFKDFY